MELENVYPDRPKIEIEVIMDLNKTQIILISIQDKIDPSLIHYYYIESDSFFKFVREAIEKEL